MENGIGERIALLRRSLGMTQEEFASAICMSRSNLSNVEKDRFTITDRVIANVCVQFHANEDWLRNGKGDMFVEISPDEEMMRDFGRLFTKDAPETAKIKKRLIRALLKLDDQQLENAVNFAKILLSDGDEE